MNLRRYLDILVTENELVTVNSEIDARLEIACLTDQLSKHGGAAVRFMQVRDTRLQLCTNLFGSERRMALALGNNSLAEFGSRLANVCETEVDGRSTLRFAGLQAAGFLESGMSQAKEVDPDLDLFPQIRFWPDEVRSFLTLAIVVTCDPQTFEPNFGIYRVGVAGKRQMSLNLLPGSGGRKHLAAWHKYGKPMPVAVLLGAPPALIFAAAANLPPGCREDRFAAWLSGAAMPMDKGKVIPCLLPTDTEIVLEGEIFPGRVIDEGPFGCFRGNYGGSNLCPIIDLHSMQIVDGPILPLTLAGPMPMEDCWLAQAQLEIDRVRLQMFMAEIEEFWQPLDAAFSGVYFIKSSTSLRVREIAPNLKQQGILRPLKALVICDEMPRDNWRSFLRDADPELIWCEDFGAISYLYNKVDLCLKHSADIKDLVLNKLSSLERKQLNF